MRAPRPPPPLTPRARVPTHPAALGLSRPRHALRTCGAPHRARGAGCVFELAAFLTTHPPSDVELLPLVLPAVGLAITLAYGIGLSAYWYVAHLSLVDASAGGPLALMRSMMPPFLLPTLVVGWLHSVTLHNQWQLEEQLAKFRVERTRCFCCDVGHRGPDGSAVHCDRATILSKLQRWFGDAAPLSGGATPAASPRAAHRLSPRDLRSGRVEPRPTGVRVFESIVRAELPACLRHMAGASNTPTPMHLALTMYGGIFWFGVDMALVPPGALVVDGTCANGSAAAGLRGAYDIAVSACGGIAVQFAVTAVSWYLARSLCVRAQRWGVHSSAVHGALAGTAHALVFLLAWALWDTLVHEMRLDTVGGVGAVVGTAMICAGLRELWRLS